jgi:26S proteasome regulatory subunit N10
LRQRIIAFVGSPLTGQAADESSMVKLAKKLKKNNVAVDFVAFGDGIEEGPLNVLRTFSETASSAENSYVINLSLDRVRLSYFRSRHYIAVQPGQLLLSDALLSSAVLAADRGLPDELMGTAGPSTQGEGGAANQFEFGVDPSLDPELAMVCNRVSLALVLGLT